MADPINIDIPDNGILNLLLNLDHGELVPTLDAELRRAVKLVKQRGQAAKLSLDITVKGYKDGVMEVTPKLTVKEPSRPLRESFMWTDRDQGLVVNQPQQADLDFNPVGGPNVTKLPNRNHDGDDD